MIRTERLRRRATAAAGASRAGPALSAAITCLVTFTPFTVFATPALAQQSLAQRIGAVTGTAELRFASRPDVCGDGGRSFSFGSYDDWHGRCMRGPVHVRLNLSNGVVTRLQTFVGGPPDSSPAAETDLGSVSTHAAVDYFVSLARRPDTPERVAADAILPAALADSTTISPALLSLAKDHARPTTVRKRALFWAGQVGEPGVLEPVRAIALDSTDGESMRRQAVFVLSQFPNDSGVPALIAIARDAEGSMPVRKQALFWLGQKDDPRVTQFLTSILEH
ncbi:MAG: HEAT repeat domain-containing protein [Gemmatimonadaceae bacterium]